MTPPHAQHTPHHHEHGTHIHHGRRYDRFATVLFGGRRRHIFTQLAARSGARPGDRVLDIGCGTGYLTRVMAQAVAPDGDVIGIDPSPEVIDHARRLTHQPNCTYTEGTATALDATDKSVDVVVSSLMIHHLPDSTRSDAIREMYRVIRPEGHVLVADFRPPGTRIGQSLVSPFVRTRPRRAIRDYVARSEHRARVAAAVDLIAKVHADAVDGLGRRPTRSSSSTSTT